MVGPRPPEFATCWLDPVCVAGVRCLDGRDDADLHLLPCGTRRLCTTRCDRDAQCIELAPYLGLSRSTTEQSRCTESSLCELTQPPTKPYGTCSENLFPGTSSDDEDAGR